MREMQTKRIGIEAARGNLGQIVDDAKYARQTTTITRHDKPAAVIVPPSWVEHLTRLCASEQLMVRGVAVRLQEAMHRAADAEVSVYVKGESEHWGDPGRAIMEARPARAGYASTQAECAAADELLERAVETLRGLGWQVAEDHRTTDVSEHGRWENVRYRIAMPAEPQD